MRTGMQKPLIVAGIVAAVGVVGLWGGSTAANAAAQTGNTNPMSSLVSAIAKKFSLKEADVQSVFDEQHAIMEAERDQRTKDQVAALVKEGNLTQAQADKINTKRAELAKERGASRMADQSLSDIEKRAKREEHAATVGTWLKDNNIDSKYAYLLGVGGRGHKLGDHGMNR